MANKKSTNTKSAKKPSTQGKSAKAQQPEEKRDSLWIISIAIFALSLLFFFIAVMPGEGVWNIFHNTYLGLFGWVASVIFPILTLVYSFLFTINKRKKGAVFDAVLILLLILFASGFIHIVRSSTDEKFIDAIVNAFKEAPSTVNGGFFGGIVGWLLLTFGKAPAIVVSLILIITVILLLFKMTVNQFFKTTAKPVKKAVEKANRDIEERRERKRMQNIDIPLDDDPFKEPDSKAKHKKKKAETKAVADENSGEALPDAYKQMLEKTKQKQEGEKEEEAKKLEAIISKPQKEEKKKEEVKKEETKLPDFKVTDEEMNSAVEDYKRPPISILKPAKSNSSRNSQGELISKAELLIETLASFGVEAEIINISQGPTVTRYELKPAPGVRINKITNLADDIALNLAATHVRIEAPIPGKSAVGIEIPNTTKSGVSMRELIETSEFENQKSLLTAGLGKDISGNNIYCDISKMPHLLIAGTTGSGKSVCMNSIIVSILYKASPKDVKLLMIDPKKVEFSKYENIPHLLVPVVTDPRKASGALGWAVSEMLKRYQTFSDTGVRNIEGYNNLCKKHDDMEPMPKIVIFIDELSDLMMAAPKEVEDSICRLAQMARAAGMHLVIATQRPSVDVITGLIKANISSRIALTVSSQIDSRTILDASGAEKLLGYGDMLYSPIGESKPLRVQGCYVSDEEIEKLCDFIRKQGESEYSEEIQKEIDNKAAQEKGAASPFTEGESDEALDPLFEKAVDVILENQRASTSFLERKLGVGYSRGSKIMDQLEEKGIIGPQDGAKPREIRINRQQWVQMQANGNIEFTSENTEQMSLDDTVEIEDSSDESEDLYDI